MARLDQLPEPMRSHIAGLPCPSFATTPWTTGPALKRRRISIVSTAGVHRRGDRPFTGKTGDYRVIPGDIVPGDLVMSHVSANFDRTGFMRDWNTVFPLCRLRELAAERIIGSVAANHYSFMGAADPADMETAARTLSRLLALDRVDGVLLVPV